MSKIIFSIGIIAAFLTVFAYFTGWSNIHDIPIFKQNDPPQPIENPSLPIEPETKEVMIQATGVGLPKDGVSNPTIRRKMAERAAIINATLQLTERIRGLTIQSITKTKDLQYIDGTVEVKVEASLKLQRVIDVKENTDGSVEVTVEAPLVQ